MTLRSTAHIYIEQLVSPLGAMIAAATSSGISLLEFKNEKTEQDNSIFIAKKLKAEIVSGENTHLTQLKNELQEYFDGKRMLFSVPLHPEGSPFQQSVWNALLEIPFGETRTYMQQAIALNNVKGIRAVASANGSNKIAVLIPCHRVIGSDGSLTGYAGGLKRKKWLLDHERKYSGKAIQGEIDFGTK